MDNWFIETYLELKLNKVVFLYAPQFEDKAILTFILFNRKNAKSVKL